MKKALTILLFALTVAIPALVVFGIYFFGPQLSRFLTGGVVFQIQKKIPMCFN